MSVPAGLSCAETLELLPFAATLETVEAAGLARHLESCAACRREAEAWSQVVGLVRGAELPVPAQHPAVMNQLLDRLALPAPPAARVVAGGGGRLPWRLALAASLVGVVVGLGAGLLSRPAATFQTLSAAGPSLTAVHLRVVFDPGTPEGAVRALLQRVGAQVVAGPTVHGVWTLELGAATEAEVALLILRADPSVRFAEQPVEPAGVGPP